MQTNELINLIQSARTPEQIRDANRAYSDYLKTDPSAEELQRVKEARAEVLNVLLDEIEVEQQTALRFLALNGKKYDLSEWLTPSEYVKKYDLRGTNVVVNWMVRGIIPESDIIEVKELNGLRLIRDRAYKETSKEVGS